jgi:DNA-directed RNA polymerase specialized sigma24 family protein
VVVLHYLADLALEDVGRATRLSPSAVKALLYRARRSLAMALTADVEEANEIAKP